MTKKFFLLSIFLLISLAIYAGMNSYVYITIVNGIGISGFARTIVKGVFYIGAFSFLLSQFLKKFHHFFLLLYFGNLWLGGLSIALTIFIMKDVLAFFFPQFAREVTYASFLIVFAVFMQSIYNVLKGVVTREVTVPVEKLAPELSGFTIVQLSDVHLGVLTSKKWLKSIVNRINDIRADIVVITGDLVDDHFSKVKKFTPIMKAIEARYGIFAVTGNHEFYIGIEDFLQFAEESNITVLNDEIRRVTKGIELIGVNDRTGKRYSGEGMELEEMMKNSDLDNVLILLSHQPVGFERAADLGVDLQLSGHTHNGQIPPMNILVSLFYKYSYGLYSYKSSFIYTTSGTGTWGPPMRLFSPSEIVKITLIKKEV